MNLIQVANTENEMGVSEDGDYAVIWIPRMWNWRPAYGYKSIVLLDADDVERVKRMYWNLHATGYVSSCSDWRRGTVFLHRYIMGLKKRDNRVVDHINRDRADCRKSNLRICTQSENTRNRGPSDDSATGYNGVTHDSENACWHAKLGFMNQKFSLGHFSDIEEAILARDIAARIADPEFIPQNFPSIEHTPELVSRIAKSSSLRPAKFMRTLQAIGELNKSQSKLSDLVVPKIPKP